MADFSKELDELFSIVNEFSSTLAYSDFIKERLIEIAVSFYYSNLVINVFDNLDDENLNLLSVQKERYRKSFGELLDRATRILNDADYSQQMDKSAYETFKINSITQLPQTKDLFDSVEGYFHIDEFPNYIENKTKQMNFIDRSKANLESKYYSLLFERKLRQDKKFSLEISEDIKSDQEEIFKDLVKSEYEGYFNENILPFSKVNKDELANFTERLIKAWEKPFDYFQNLIDFSLVSIMNWRADWLKQNESSFKVSALIALHARSVRICKEILTLLKYGYADGAHTRWRTLHELEVIAAFLHKNEDVISERYFHFQEIVSYELFKKYNKYIDRINEDPLLENEKIEVEKRVKDLRKKYTNFDYERGWGWISPELRQQMGLKPGTRIGLHHLEEFVGLDHMSPYYKWASDSIHGNSSGFFPLGMGETYTLMVCPSNIGLTDPLHAASLSLWRVTMNLLLLNPSIKNLFIFYCLKDITDKIGNIAIQIEQSLKGSDNMHKSSGI